jgi:hypothetical protein
MFVDFGSCACERVFVCSTCVCVCVQAAHTFFFTRGDWLREFSTCNAKRPIVLDQGVILFWDGSLRQSFETVTQSSIALNDISLPYMRLSDNF